VDQLWQAFQHQLDELLGACAELQLAQDVPALPNPAHRAHEVALKQAWARWALVPQEAIGPQSHWMKQGGTSMAAIRMAAQLQREAGITLNLSAFFLAPTFAGLCASVQVQASESLARWVFVGPPDAEHLHVLIPGAGGHAEGLVRLAHAMLEPLGAGHALAILDLDGLCEKAPTQGVLAWLQEALAQQLRLLPAGRIRSLQGFSLGGLLALAMSTHNLGRDLMPVVLIDTWAPRAFHEDAVRTAERLLYKAWRWLRALPAMATEPDQPVEELLAQAASTRLERTPRVIWDLLSAEMASQPFGAPRAQVFFVTARQTAEQLHLIWRRASRGFIPSLYASWQQAELPCDHLDLPRHMAPRTAALIVNWLRSVQAAGQ